MVPSVCGWKKGKVTRESGRKETALKWALKVTRGLEEGTHSRDGRRRACMWHWTLALRAGMGGDGCLTLFEREYSWEKGRAGQNL